MHLWRNTQGPGAQELLIPNLPFKYHLDECFFSTRNILSLMENRALLSRCGIYCGACYIYRAERDGGDYLARTAEQQKVEPGKVHCMGCSGPSDEMWVNCRLCPVRGCQDEKGYDNCAECPKFSDRNCENYERLADFCLRRGEDVRASLVKLSVEPEEWLRQQSEKWRCHSCGRLISWYDETCRSCGGLLERTNLRS